MGARHLVVGLLAAICTMPCFTLALARSAHGLVRPAARTLRPARAAVRASENLGLDFLVNAPPGSEDDLAAIEVGSRVRVVTTPDVVFYHVPKHPELNPNGLEGTVVRIIDGISANKPVVVQFETPRPFRAHFEPRELELLP